MFSRSFIRQWVNRAWIVSCAREHARFTAALGRVAETQTQGLLNLLKHNAETQFGRRHGFASIRSVAEFQARVPLTHYEALTESIEAIARGEPGVLTQDRVRLFQPTSGSSSATKLIPWTATLNREFRRGIAPWVVALYRRKPELLGGSAYWSISPPGTARQRHGRLPVGFDNDAAYLGFLGKHLFPLVSTAPPGLAQCCDMREFKTKTLVSLLADENLGLISIWSPTFLTTLLDDFWERREEILDAVSQGKRAGAHQRAEFLRRRFQVCNGPTSFEQVWPHLQVISCWTHGPSELYAKNLQGLFPKIEIQGKGLVATEAFVSLPFHEGQDPVLAVTAHFFEFQEIASEKYFLAWELIVGNTYRVIVTTGGGLYRYPLGDLVRVTGFIQDAPCLRFIGREGSVSDLFGEKLQGAFVEEVICRVLAQQAIKPRFFLLAPVTGARVKPAYTLFLDADALHNAAALQRNLEKGLADNFHYAHCRRLGQLSESRIFQINRDALSAATVFQQEMLSRGIKLGNIKMGSLDGRPVWDQRFNGQFIA
jgi:hypothetical protein